ncbi:MAG: FxsA family protein [Thermodesulfovibrionales bacterium]|nr:FxsA family protein [Thermodesulfovibrionales bacterium]
MFFRLFLLFSIVPAVELALLVYAGSMIGVPETLSIVIATAIAGAFLVRREGLGVLFRIKEDLAQGAFPAESLLDGAMVLVSGALLLTPGFITDLIGFLLVIPASRAVMKKILLRLLRRHLESISIEINKPPR